MQTPTQFRATSLDIATDLDLRCQFSTEGRRAQLEHVIKYEFRLGEFLSSMILGHARRARDQISGGVQYVEETGSVDADVEQ